MDDPREMSLSWIIAHCETARMQQDVDLLCLAVEQVADEADKDLPAILNVIRNGLKRTLEETQQFAQRLADAKKSKSRK